MLYITIEGSIAFRPPPSIVRRSLGSINDLGQEVTPLKRALRRHAAEAIVRLLDADAMVQGDDPSGWTTMQIAAYEGAARSVPILLPLGADINERTPVQRQQTPIMTALQHSNLQTISALVSAGADLNATDSEGKTACDWAELFKRDEAIRNLVCEGRRSFDLER